MENLDNEKENNSIEEDIYTAQEEGLVASDLSLSKEVISYFDMLYCLEKGF